MKNKKFGRLGNAVTALGMAAVMGLSGCGNITAKTASTIEFSETDFGKDKFEYLGDMYKLDMTMVEPETHTDSNGQTYYSAPKGAFMFDNGRCYKFVFEKITEEEYEATKEDGILIGFDCYTNEEGNVVESYKYAPIIEKYPCTVTSIKIVDGKEVVDQKTDFAFSYMAPSFCTRVDGFGGDSGCYVDVVYKNLENTESNSLKLNK